MLDDPQLPLAPTLLGPGAEHVVRSAAEAGGGELTRLTVRQAHYKPGRSLAVVYAALVDSATVGLVGMTTAGEDSPCVWRVRSDPLLPGLRHALSGSPAVLLRSYRPGRRAVVEVASPARRFLKVVTPGRAAPLAAAYEHLAWLPVPRVLAADDALGVVTLSAVAGTPLVRCIERGDDLPSGAAVLRLVERMASVPGSGVVNRSLRGSAPAHAHVVVATAPGTADAVEALLAGIGHDPPATPVTVHGDLHGSQLLVTGGVIAGVVDLDRSGTGDVADDLARMLAHLDALAIHRPAIAGAAERYCRGLWREFSATTDPDDLRQRVAAALIGLATTPFRWQRPCWEDETALYLAAAGSWLSGERWSR